ncbi:hypothetical protein [Haloechinothrix salitolerans]|uniref:Uncharacterized protein n=1 Tax=Haloechinothrix salitolerans TaxID=926830 RepID=A0ABW2C8Y6_9PSEU
MHESTEAHSFCRDAIERAEARERELYTRLIKLAEHVGCLAQFVSEGRAIGGDELDDLVHNMSSIVRGDSR